MGTASLASEPQLSPMVFGFNLDYDIRKECQNGGETLLTPN